MTLTGTDDRDNLRIFTTLCRFCKAAILYFLILAERQPFCEKKFMSNLIDELRTKIIDTLKLEDVLPEDMGEEDQLVGGELGLDSIDVLELVIMIEKDYGVKIDNKELGARVFANLRALAGYIEEKASKGIS